MILAVSADGFLARGPDDDMSWTSQTDKKLFRLLTLVGPLLLAGATTAKLLPKLPGRTVVPLSRRGLALSDMQSADGWLIGGPTVAQEALRLGMVRRVFLCYGTAILGSGIPVQPILSLLPAEPLQVIQIDDVAVKIYAP